MSRKDCWVYTLGERNEWIVVTHFGTIILEINRDHRTINYIGGYSATDRDIMNEVISWFNLQRKWYIKHYRKNNELELREKIKINEFWELKPSKTIGDCCPYMVDPTKRRRFYGFKGKPHIKPEEMYIKLTHW